MTSAIHTAVGEIQRTGIDALRGLGFSFALADRVTSALTWAEAVHGCGLRIIQQNERRIREAAPRAFGYSERTIGSLSCNLLDAAGKSLLESGPRAFDLADAQAKIAGVGLVLVRRTFDTAWLGEFIIRSIERGLGSLALYQPIDIPSSEDAGDRCEIILGLPDGTMEAAVAAPRKNEPAAETPIVVARDFAPLLGDIAGTAVAAAVSDAMAQKNSGSGLSNLMLVSFNAQGHKTPSGLDALTASFDRCVASTSRWRIAHDYIDRWRRAVDEGFEVDPADWKYLFSLVAQTRVATSERSQSQAG